MKVVTFERCPSMCYDRKNDSFSGYDWEVIQELSRQFNFKKNVTFLDGPQQWGEIMKNGTPTGALKLLIDGEAEIGLGNFFLRQSRVRLLDASTQYFSIPLILVIPSGEVKFQQKT